MIGDAGDENVWTGELAWTGDFDIGVEAED